MKIVIALGGNAILNRGEPLEAINQIQHIQAAVTVIAKIAQEHEVILCHGNGPQVGLLVLENEHYQEITPYPLDVLVAETQGMLGYWLQRELKNQLPDTEVVTLLNQVIVDPYDPAFHNPSKFIGPQYPVDKLKQLEQRGWSMRLDNNMARRVVPSPQPQAIVELNTIAELSSKGHIVICGGGGGIPVIEETEKLKGVEAVIDKDHTAALIAEKLDADCLLILTDVDGIYQNWNTPQQKLIRKISAEALAQHHLAKGSMGPKVEACCDYVKQTGNAAAIGLLSEAQAILSGNAGTHIVP